jgi:hypothetical protein
MIGHGLAPLAIAGFDRLSHHQLLPRFLFHYAYILHKIHSPLKSCAADLMQPGVQ